MSISQPVQAKADGPVIRLPLGAMVVLVGPAGSGKSTWAARHFLPTQIISSDACRGMIADDESDQTVSRDAFRLLYFILNERLRRGLVTVVDSTALQPSVRAELLKIAAQHGRPAIAIVFALPTALNEQWNASRDRRVPYGALERHWKNLDLSQKHLPTESFQTVHTFHSPEELAASRVLIGGFIPERDTPPFDMIGDVHGCYDELRALFAGLGYQWQETVQSYIHPDGRLPVFVGDLTDRGPASLAVLKLVERMVSSDHALLVQGNHDNKLLRWLIGRKVQVWHGLAMTIAELEALPQEEQETLRPRFIDLLQNAPGYLILDGGRLVITHAGIQDEMVGRWNRAIQAFCLYGDVVSINQGNMPLRRNWAALRSEAQATHGPLIVYGHDVVEEVHEFHRTINIDTGCVFGGRLSALRYPEMEVAQVPAARAYYQKEARDKEIAAEVSADMRDYSPASEAGE
ncbi:MAG TPA: AAA family ATPase [Ktedonobacterales bacterium]|nr:AAA family ATPase [Ktedonobacterales bacterium]